MTGGDDTDFYDGNYDIEDDDIYYDDFDDEFDDDFDDDYETCASSLCDWEPLMSTQAW